MNMEKKQNNPKGNSCRNYSSLERFKDDDIDKDKKKVSPKKQKGY